jgi:hypothetical protein
MIPRRVTDASFWRRQRNRGRGRDRREECEHGRGGGAAVESLHARWLA